MDETNIEVFSNGKIVESPVVCDVFYTPPSFKVCPECGGEGDYFYESERFHEDRFDITCKTCHGTGRIPVWYTVPQWEELTGRKVPDDMPVWSFIPRHRPIELVPYLVFKDMKTLAEKMGDNPFCVIATEAGQPPVDFKA